MARFLVKASEYKNVCKAVNDRQLESLKKEIIEILKKQDEKDVKKAIDYFNSQEEHYTHLEKSLISGKWIQKAGYGVGTVRIWKGKKYKKIAPGKWARVFDKEGRGTNIAIGKLIARVQKIDNVEDLMAFVMQNKQRFVDENGIDLPVLDKLRAAVDAKNNGGMGSKTTSKPAEKTDGKYDKELVDSWKDDYKNFSTDALKEKIEEYTKVLERAKNDNPSPDQRVAVKQNEHRLKALNELLEEKKNKPAEKKGKVDDYKKQLEDVVKKELVNQKEDIASLYEIRDRGLSGKYAAGLGLTKKDKETSIEDRIQEAAEWLVEHPKGNPKSIGKMLARVELAKEFEKDPDWRYGKKEESENPIDNRIQQEIEYKKYDEMNLDQLNAEIKELTLKQTGRVKAGSDEEKVVNGLKKYVLDLKKEKESEAEKTQNRSEAMKGNQNAKKYGLTDEQIERYDIQEVVEDVNGYGIVKNSEGKYSFIEDGRVKDRPDDFETDINKVKERINDANETKKNIEAAKNYDFANADFGPDVKYTKKNNGKHEYYKKDGSKAISVTIDVSDMREPLNMTYEVTDTKSGKSWQYETAYGNKEGLEWAVERPEQMEKELKKFFKRDPEKEWNKQNTTDSITNFESEGKVVSYDELKPIATNKSVGENEVQLPYSKDLANEIESLKNCTAPKWEPRDFLKHVYYENGKLITTDARRMKFIEVGELEGIPDGSYVDINTDKSGINIKKIDVDARFPNYSKVIPEDLKQTATLDTKLVKDKIKEMQKDGAIDKKGTNLVQLEFRDGKVFIDDTAVGEAKDIKMKYSDDWGPARNDTNYMAINADYFVNALSGKTSVLQIGERADKAIAINTGSTSNILMPMSGSDKKMDYGQGRQAKKDANDKKAEERKKNKDYNFELLKDVREGKLTSSQVEKVAENIDGRLSSFTDEELQREWARLNYDIDKGFEKKALKSVNDIIDNKLHLSGYAAIAYSMLKERHPEIREKLATELEKRGISVKKSLFDDFIVDVFEADDEEEIEEDKENESLFNDYSAEQPELFNSTEMKVQEAFNRCGCCL